MKANNFLKIGVGALCLAVAVAIFFAAAFWIPAYFESQPAQANGLEATPTPVAQTTEEVVEICLPTDELITILNEYHAIDRNDATPVIEWLLKLPGVTAFKAGDTIPRAEDGFRVIFTLVDIDPERFTWSPNGTFVAYYGGGRGTIFGAYDTAVISPVNGWYIDIDWCYRINPEADLAYWGGFVEATKSVVEPTEIVAKATPYPVVDELLLGGGHLSTCQDTDELITILNEYHAIDRNDATPVIEWLLKLPGVTAFKAGDTIPRAEDGFRVIFTLVDIDPERFTWSPNGTFVAYYGGGRGTIFGAYDTAVISPVNGWYIDIDWCYRINPEADLAYWGR